MGVSDEAIRMYDRLEPDKISETLERLQERITERFPDAGIGRVSAALVAFSRSSAARVAEIERPRPLLRLLLGLVIAGGAMLLVWLGQFIAGQSATSEAFGMIQGIDAGFNILVLMGGAVFYLVTLESRIKRGRSLKDLHTLRSIVHVIDMHQLTKDPSATLAGGAPTKHSPRRTMSSFELMRYLDYCSEMLSLTGKLAALYAQSSRDPSVVGAVNDLEQLAANLSQKVWQKITIIKASEGIAHPAVPAPPAPRSPGAASRADEPPASPLPS
jgi:hypothetical protein